MTTSTTTPRPKRGHVRASRGDRACLGLAGLLVTLIAAGGVVVGALSFAPSASAGGEIYRLHGDGTAVLAQVLGRNLATALLLFSGYATLGASTLLGLVFTASWVGAGSAAVAAETGWHAVSPLVVLYLPFEFAGLALAAVAGLTPLAHAVRRFAAESDVPVHSHARPALVLLAAAVTCIVVGAGLELLVIDLHHV